MPRKKKAEVAPITANSNSARALAQDFLKRWSALQSIKDDMMESQKDLFAEAKAKGFTVAQLRAVFAESRKDRTEVAEAEAVKDLYRHLLGLGVE